MGQMSRIIHCELRDVTEITEEGDFRDEAENLTGGVSWAWEGVERDATRMRHTPTPPSSPPLTSHTHSLDGGCSAAALSCFSKRQTRLSTVRCGSTALDSAQRGGMEIQETQ